MTTRQTISAGNPQSTGGDDMNVRRLVMDVDMAISRPSIPDIAESLSKVEGVEAVNITVESIDIETVGMDITVEGTLLDHRAVQEAIDKTGAIVHSIDEMCVGDRMIDHRERVRGR
jgi:hypothetical protein